jgi:cytochrome c oxidase subunit 2
VRRGSIVQLLLLSLVFAGAATAIALLIPWLPPVASKERHRIDIVFWVATAICIGIFAIVASAIAFAVLKFRRAPDDDSDGPPIHGHTGLEIAWTAIPAVLVTSIAIVSSIVLVKNGRAGANPLRVTVTAQQFEWSFKYTNHAAEGVVSPVLYLPRGQSVKLTLLSVDVIHSFWVPEFGQKQDAVPGTTQHLVITPTKDGTYPVICTELCGLGHANGCNSCHTLAAAGAKGKVGPDLDRLTAEAKRAGKPLDAFVRESIVDPNAYIEPGFPKGVMPPGFGTSIPKPQLDALVQFLVQSAKGAK